MVWGRGHSSRGEKGRGGGWGEGYRVTWVGTWGRGGGHCLWKEGNPLCNAMAFGGF